MKIALCITQGSPEKQNQYDRYEFHIDDRQINRFILRTWVSSCDYGADKSEICKAALQSGNSGRISML